MRNFNYHPPFKSLSIRQAIKGSEVCTVSSAFFPRDQHTRYSGLLPAPWKGEDVGAAVGHSDQPRDLDASSSSPFSLAAPVFIPGHLLDSPPFRNPTRFRVMFAVGWISIQMCCWCPPSQTELPHGARRDSVLPDAGQLRPRPTGLSPAGRVQVPLGAFHSALCLSCRLYVLH